MPIDYATDEGRVRLLISDVDPDKPILSDPQIGAFLDLTGSVYRAAADALDAIASSEALLSKKITTMDRQSDGPAVAAELRKHAASLRARATEDEQVDDSFFFITPSSDRSSEGEEAKF